ncbi:MAG: hypothetical protein QG635_2310 [Bacteroidota bacterium]|nr:hypothetical protein [Bacteroidota bacterium]
MATEEELLEKIEELQTRYNNLNDEITEMMKYFEFAIVETKDDMRIINSNGAVDEIFKDVIKNFNRGENLVKLIYRTCKNTKEKEELKEVISSSGSEEFPDEEQEDLEDSIQKFTQTGREERIIKIVGEKEDGEIFLLQWVIKKKNNIYRSFFKAVPTNGIVKAAQEKHKIELEQNRNNIKETLGHIKEGITILDLKSTIIYMNDAAKKYYISHKNQLLKNAPVEGRFFKEVFVTEDPEEVKKINDYNRRVIVTRKPITYYKKLHDIDIEMNVFPLINEKNNVIGVTIISRTQQIAAEKKPDTSASASMAVDTKKLLLTIKSLSEDKRMLLERANELDNNFKWLMKNNKEYHETIKQYYLYLDMLPTAVSIQLLPSMKFDFINRQFERKFGKGRDEVRGKEDSDMFSPDTVLILNQKYEEAVQTRKAIDIDTGFFHSRQIVIFGSDNNPSHLMRIYFD